MEGQEKARLDDRANNAISSKHTAEHMGNQARRRPRPDELKARIDPLEFYRSAIGHFPDAVKRGKEGWTQNFRCPFHSPDDRGSFGVNLDTGAFRCFACQAKGGSVIDFLMLRDQVTLVNGHLN